MPSVGPVLVVVGVGRLGVSLEQPTGAPRGTCSEAGPETEGKAWGTGQKSAENGRSGARTQGVWAGTGWATGGPSAAGTAGAGSPAGTAGSADQGACTVSWGATSISAMLPEEAGPEAPVADGRTEGPPSASDARLITCV